MKSQSQQHKLCCCLLSSVNFSFVVVSLVVTALISNKSEPVQCFQQHNLNSRLQQQEQSAELILQTSLNNNNSANQNHQQSSNLLHYEQANIPVSLQTTEDTNALKYLQRFGYLSRSESNSQLISEDSFTNAVIAFQRFVGLPETGSVNAETLHYMQLPRCGNKDKLTAGTNQIASLLPLKPNGQPSIFGRNSNGGRGNIRKRRFALQGSKWRRQELTYRISQYPTKFSHKKHEVDSQIERAFSIWSEVAPIDFIVQREGRVHIDIRFASGDHGDGDSFDGPGNTLAHAYFPQYGGDAHFDDQEYWTVDSFTGTNIFQVAAHELGHSLGLGHSNVREALMAPFYQKYRPNFTLHNDDMLAIQALYGEKPTTPLTTTTPLVSATSTTLSPQSTNTWFRSSIDRRQNPLFPPRTHSHGDRRVDQPAVDGNGIEDDLNDEQPPNKDSPRQEIPGVDVPGNDAGNGDIDLCANPKMDAITRVQDGTTYMFKGDYYWQLIDEGVAAGYPRRISDDWSGLPSNIDAALTWPDGKTFIFQGDKYWRFRNKVRDTGYPKLISVGFAGIPNDVDTAFVWSGNGRTYFFKGSDYWRFDSKSDPPVSSEYPKSIKIWSGLPSANIDAAFKWYNDVTYFFKDDLYYRFNDKEFRVEARGRPTFPRNTASWWFSCTHSKQKRKNSSSLVQMSGSSVDTQQQQVTLVRNNNNSSADLRGTNWLQLPSFDFVSSSSSLLSSHTNSPSNVYTSGALRFGGSHVFGNTWICLAIMILFLA